MYESECCGAEPLELGRMSICSQCLKDSHFKEVCDICGAEEELRKFDDTTICYECAVELDYVWFD